MHFQNALHNTALLLSACTQTPAYNPHTPVRNRTRKTWRPCADHQHRREYFSKHPAGVELAITRLPCGKESVPGALSRCRFQHVKPVLCFFINQRRLFSIHELKPQLKFVRYIFRGAPYGFQNLPRIGICYASIL